MKLTKVDHVAYITPDMEGTIRFYRDLLGMKLVAGVGHQGFRHYFFQIGDALVAFFHYDIAKPMEYDKFHGTPTDKPIGFDHISFTVDSREDLFAMKDMLEAAEIEVHGAVDHGIFWSIYFFDPVNNIPLEISWNFFDFQAEQAIYEVEPLEAAEEGPEPQAGRWPAVKNPTPPEKMTATSGNGFAMRESFLQRGLGSITDQGKAAGIHE